MNRQSNRKFWLSSINLASGSSRPSGYLERKEPLVLGPDHRLQIDLGSQKMGNVYSGSNNGSTSQEQRYESKRSSVRGSMPTADRRPSTYRRSKPSLLHRRALSSGLQMAAAPSSMSVGGRGAGGGGAGGGGGGGGALAAATVADHNNVNEAHNHFAFHPNHEPSLPLTKTLGASAMPSALGQRPGIKIARLRVGIDKRLTVIDEKSASVLKYRTPHFRAMATVEVPPLQAGERIQIGWIQVCIDMQFINVYGQHGITSWEFPEIVTGKFKMISDADGKQYPWYGSRNEVCTLEGPTPFPTSATIHMNDNFFPQVTWYVPDSSYSREPALTYVYRKQRFLTFLALKDLMTNTYHIMKTVAWSMELGIQVNPQNELGKRAKLIGPMEQEKPRVLNDKYAQSMRIEKYALNPPNANNSQVLVWRPRFGEPSMIIAPIQTTMDMEMYLLATDDVTEKLFQLARQLQSK